MLNEFILKNIFTQKTFLNHFLGNILMIEESNMFFFRFPKLNKILRIELVNAYFV
jgi:hypothetical protein